MLASTHDCSRCVTVHMLAKESEVFAMFRVYTEAMENTHDARIKCLRSDNGGEYLDDDFQIFLLHNDIGHERSAPRRQAQNGVAERMGRTLIEMARTIMMEAKVAGRWWAEAVATAAYLRNRANRKALPRDQTPFEELSGRKADVSSLCVFGCRVISKDDAAEQLDERGRAGIMIGCSTVSDAYRLLDLRTAT